VSPTADANPLSDPGAQAQPPAPPLDPITPVANAAKQGTAKLGAVIDPGWLFLFAGVALLGATVIIPAQRELEDAQYLKLRVQTVQEHRSARLANYAQFLGKLESGDKTLMAQVVAAQQNQVDSQLELILPADDGLQVEGVTLPKAPTAIASGATVPGASDAPASPFPALEPAPLRLPQRVVVPTEQRSTLERWSTDSKARLWLIATGAVCIGIGLFPFTRWRQG